MCVPVYVCLRAYVRACMCASQITYSVPNAVRMSTEQDREKSFLTEMIKSSLWRRNWLTGTVSLGFTSCLSYKHRVVIPWQQARKAAGLIQHDGNCQYVNWYRAAFENTHAQTLARTHTFTYPAFSFNQSALLVGTERRGRAGIDQKAWWKLLQRLRGRRKVWTSGALPPSSGCISFQILYIEYNQHKHAQFNLSAETEGNKSALEAL